MTFKDLQKFIKDEHKRMIEHWGLKEDPEKRTLLRTVKLMEEMGELCEEILGFSAQQRKEKNRRKDEQKLAEELADILIVALLLAENLELDILTALKKKIEKIEQRHKASLQSLNKPMPKIILASSSPRRKELLCLLFGDNFEVQESGYEEDNTLNLSPKDLVLHHSLQKAKDVAGQIGKAIVIGADTVVVFGDETLGKPKSSKQAKEMLKKISGKVVKVITGIAVVKGKKQLQDYEVTKLKMKEMSEKEIEDYIKTDEPLDKAGAFAIQGKGAILVEKIDGCYFNVVGLPLFKVSQLLRKVGVEILK